MSRIRPSGLRWLAGAMLIFGFALVVSGCGGSSSGSTAAEAENASGPPEQGTLHVAVLVGVGGERAQKLAPQFEQEHPGIKLDITPIAYESVFPKEVLDASQHTDRYDVYTINNAQLGVFASNGYIVPIEPFLADKELVPKDLDLSDYYSSYINGLTKYKGKMYVTPYSFWLMDQYYREDIFSDPKVQAEYKQATGEELEPAKTYEQMYNQAKFFTKEGHYGFGMDGAKGGPGSNTYQWIPILWNYGGELLSDNDTCAAFNSQQGVEALEYYASLVPYSPPSYTENIADQNTSLFQQGKLITSGLHDSDQFGYINDPENSKPEVVNNVGLTISPSGPKGPPPIIHMAGWTLGINADSKMQKAAAAYAMWMAAKGRAPVQAEFGEPQARKSWLDDPANQKEYPQYKAMVESLPHAKAIPVTPQWAEVQDALALAIQQVVTGQEEAKSALDQAAETSDRALGCSQ
jgi:multiple sugar transport system substrate-binding protein